MQTKFWAVSSACLLTGAALLTSVPALADGEASESEAPAVEQSVENNETTPQTAETTAETPAAAESAATEESAASEETPAAEPTETTMETEVTEQDMATVTAEGDFLLPTYMLPDGPEAIEDEIPESPIFPQKTITRPKTDLPIKELASAKLKKAMEARPAPQPVAEQPTQQGDNPIIIPNDPIPAAAFMQPALTAPSTPQPIVVPYNPTVTTSQSNTSPLTAVPTTTPTMPNIDDLLSGLELNEPTEDDTVDKPKKSLLLPIRGKIIRSEIPEEKAPVLKKRTLSSDVADKVLAASGKGGTGAFLMPQDLKLTFYPNATDFSGQTVKWIKAFSIKAARDPRYIVEIRLSQQNPVIQQKRLFVIQNILSNNGLSAHQLAVTYVDRPENSLVLRIVKKGEETQTTEIISKTGRKSSNTLISW